MYSSVCHCFEYHFHFGGHLFKGGPIGNTGPLIKKGDLEGRPFLERGAFWKETTEIKLFLQYNWTPISVHF